MPNKQTEEIIKIVEERIKELKSIYSQIQDKHEYNRLMFRQNPDSISLREKVISDENSGYICEVWGRLNELEELLNNLKET